MSRSHRHANERFPRRASCSTMLTKAPMPQTEPFSPPTRPREDPEPAPHPSEAPPQQPKPEPDPFKPDWPRTRPTPPPKALTNQLGEKLALTAIELAGAELNGLLSMNKAAEACKRPPLPCPLLQ